MNCPKCGSKDVRAFPRLLIAFEQVGEKFKPIDDAETILNLENLELEPVTLICSLCEQDWTMDLDDVNLEF